MSVIHDSDCSVHNEPALSAAPCDCSAWPKEYHRLHMAALKAYAAPEGEENYAAFAAADDALWAFVKHNFKAARGVAGPKCDRCRDTGWHYSDPMDPTSLEPCCEPATAGVPTPEGGHDGA